MAAWWRERLGCTPTISELCGLISHTSATGIIHSSAKRRRTGAGLPTSRIRHTTGSSRAHTSWSRRHRGEVILLHRLLQMRRLLLERLRTRRVPPTKEALSATVVNRGGSRSPSAGR